MKTLEKAQDKIKKICDVIRDETLEPAKKEASQIIFEAQKQAEQIIAEAQKSAEQLHAEARKSIEQEKSVFQASVEQASRQSLESLRQSIENKLFSTHLTSIIEKSSSDPHLVANLINAIVKALEKDGLTADLTAIIPKTIAPRAVNELLLADVLNTLKDKSVTVGTIAGGAQVKLNKKQMTIDISEHALKELLSSYVIRKDFRKMIFEV